MQLVDELGPVVGQAVLRDLAEVVCGALAGHASTCRNRVAHLVDQHFIGEELELFFLAVSAVIAIGRLTTELDGQIEADLIT